MFCCFSIPDALLLIVYYKHTIAAYSIECSAAYCTCMYEGTGSHPVFSGRGAAGEVTEQAVVGGDSKPSISENCSPRVAQG